MNLGHGTMGPQFKIAQDEETEFARIHEHEVFSIEGQVVRPDLHVRDPYFEVKRGLLYRMKKGRMRNENTWHLLVS